MTGPLLLSAKLALVTTVLLLPVALPVAWWLANTRSVLKASVQAVVALPLVLPPTVLGFYFLLFLSPGAPLGRLWVDLTGGTLTFSFSGLVLASLVYSLPFAVQPLQSAFETLGRDQYEAARTLGATSLDAFLRVVVPMTLPGLVSAVVLTFAHTLGEFGIVLMVGGNIPGETRTVSIAIYDHVENLVLLVTFVINQRARRAR